MTEEFINNAHIERLRNEPPFAYSGDNKTLMSFGYEYNRVGMLTGIADWRGRDASGGFAINDLDAPHPSQVVHGGGGYHWGSMPSFFDESMRSPSAEDFNNGVVHGATGWPVGALPSDAKFDYDGRYQLSGEDRGYYSGSGDPDFRDDALIVEGAGTGKRVRSLNWSFDSRGSMNSWTEAEDDGQVGRKNLGRALGGTIINGWQRNVSAGNEGCMYALEGSAEVPSGCYIPDALYFATNAGDEGVQDGEATCVWVDYDSMGRMVWQKIRTGCSSCSLDDDPESMVCEGSSRVPGQYVKYHYEWNAVGQLGAASRYENGLEKIKMTYRYDASGSRVVREKSNIVGGDATDIYQDLYWAYFVLFCVLIQSSLRLTSVLTNRKREKKERRQKLISRLCMQKVWADASARLVRGTSKSDAALVAELARAFLFFFDPA